MTHWHSLYLSSKNRPSIISTIEDGLLVGDYNRYNPFAVLPGKSYPSTMKFFVAPTLDSWTRILADSNNDPDTMDSILCNLSKYADVLSVRLQGNHGSLHSFREGQLIDLATWCQAHLMDVHTDIQKLLETEQFNLPPLSTKQIGDVPINALPDDLQQMAREINATTANGMFQKLSQKLRKTIGYQNASQLLTTRTNWDSQGGQLIRAVMAVLTIPDTWQTPDFASLRSAYTIKTRQEQGIGVFGRDDETLLASIPNIMDYQPIYSGKMNT